MANALDHIESAIAEVSKARASVKRGASMQVRSSTEIDQLKSVAFAWFQTHRPIVARCAVDIAAIDAPYQAVLRATSMLAARRTYTQAFQDAKRALVAAREAIAVNGSSASSASTPDVAPSFAALTADQTMQRILERRWEEVQQCMSAGAFLAATVMMGGLLETLLLAKINVTQNKTPIFTAKTTPRDKAGKALPLGEWKLVAMVEVSHELGWITKSTKDVGNVLREFRNYIHPHKEHTDGVTISAEDTRMFWEVCKAISRQVLSTT